MPRQICSFHHTKISEYQGLIRIAYEITLEIGQIHKDVSKLLHSHKKATLFWVLPRDGLSVRGAWDTTSRGYWRPEFDPFPETWPLIVQAGRRSYNGEFLKCKSDFIKIRETFFLQDSSGFDNFRQINFQVLHTLWMIKWDDVRGERGKRTLRPILIVSESAVFSTCAFLLNKRKLDIPDIAMMKARVS